VGSDIFYTSTSIHEASSTFNAAAAQHRAYSIPQKEINIYEVLDPLFLVKWHLHVLKVTALELLVGAPVDDTLENELSAFISFCNCNATLPSFFLPPAFGFSSIFAFRISLRSCSKIWKQGHDEQARQTKYEIGHERDKNTCKKMR